MIGFERMGTSAVALLLAMASPAAGQDPAHAHGEERPEALGRVEFPISCSAEANEKFGRAMALLHSFWWSEAGRAFDAVAESDPTCAMAHWGKAMVARGNWFAGAPSPTAAEAGLAAVERGLELGAGSPRERGYLEAAETLFRGSAAGDYRSAALAYEDRMRALHEAEPEDAEAAIFYALAITANATPGDRSFERQHRAGELLEGLFVDRPDHPGIAHYIIHTYDAPPIASRGVEAARRYGEIAPSVPHAQHMPSHIFTRLGMWDASIESNRASAESARQYEVSQGMTAVSFDRAHAWDYLVYAHLQQGQDAAAARLVQEVAASTGVPSIATDYAFAAIPARYALERGRWGEAADLQVRPSPGFPAGEAITHFARGVGAARSGQTAAARREIERLEIIRVILRTRDVGYWADAVEAQRLAVSALVARANGDDEGALRLIGEAADLEERIEKHPVTPGPILPARELQGDLLMEMGRPAHAHRAYEAALQREPRRARSVHGAAVSARAAGDLAAARARYSELVELMERGDAKRPEFEEARIFLTGR